MKLLFTVVGGDLHTLACHRVNARIIHYCRDSAGGRIEILYLLGRVAPLFEPESHFNGICHSRTRDLAEVTRRADVLVVAIGKADFITGDMVKEGAVVIDVGMNRRADGKLTGDVDFATVEPKASHITPVPGGVGPMTITMLMQNTLTAAMDAAGRA